MGDKLVDKSARVWYNKVIIQLNDGIMPIL